MTAWFVNLSTRAKLFFGFGLMIALLLIVTATAYLGMTMVLQSNQAVARNFAAVSDFSEVRSKMNRSRVNLLEMMLNTDREQQRRLKEESRAIGKEIDAMLQSLAQRFRNDRQIITDVVVSKRYFSQVCCCAKDTGNRLAFAFDCPNDIRPFPYVA